jgi:hypothetical protein
MPSNLQMKMYTMNRQYSGPALAMILLLLIGCTPAYKPFTSNYRTTETGEQPDYRNLYYWAAHPQKKDPSDSVPATLQSESRDTVADVFFLHPTTYTRSREGWNADINKASLNAKTDYTTILFQSTAFNQHARVFAPRYRQAHLSVFYQNDSALFSAFDTAYADIRKAFVDYLEHHHHNRPIIIAAHSQGALMAIRLLKEFFDGRPLQQKLVAAYVAGWPVKPSDFNGLTICSTSMQTGCVCSWRTFKQGYWPAYVKREKEKAWVTNPLSWTADSAYVSREENKGSVLRDFNAIVPKTTDAQVSGGVLWINRPKFPGSVFYRTRNYHIGDINLYWMNIRMNVEQRLRAYQNKRSAL